MASISKKQHLECEKKLWLILPRESASAARMWKFNCYYGRTMDSIIIDFDKDCEGYVECVCNFIWLRWPIIKLTLSHLFDDCAVSATAIATRRALMLGSEGRCVKSNHNSVQPEGQCSHRISQFRTFTPHWKSIIWWVIGERLQYLWPSAPARRINLRIELSIRLKALKRGWKMIKKCLISGSRVSSSLRSGELSQNKW